MTAYLGLHSESPVIILDTRDWLLSIVSRWLCYCCRSDIFAVHC